jgi:hypothetical protein
MTADLLDALRAADPAADLPDTPAADRERLRRAVIAGETRSSGQGLRRSRYGLVLAAALAAAALLLGGTVVYATRAVPPPIAPAPTPTVDTLMTAKQVRAEYRLWTQKLPLPQGVQWRKERLGHGGEGSGDMYGGNTGVMDAITWAICAWSREWVAAADAEDEVRIGAAAEALERIVNVMPEWHEGMSENQGGWDSAAIDSFKGAVEAAKQGDLTGVRQFAGWFEDEE